MMLLYVVRPVTKYHYKGCGLFRQCFRFSLTYFGTGENMTTTELTMTEYAIKIKNIVEEYLVGRKTDPTVKITTVIKDAVDMFRIILTDGAFSAFKDVHQYQTVENKEIKEIIDLIYDDLQFKKSFNEVPKLHAVTAQNFLPKQTLSDQNPDIVTLIKAVLYNTKIKKVTIKTTGVEISLETDDENPQNQQTLSTMCQ